MQIAYSKTRTQYPLSYKKIFKKTLDYTISTIIIISFLLFIIWIPLKLSPGSFRQEWINIINTVAFGIVVFLFFFVALTFFYQYWYFAVYFYDFTEDFVQIRKGPITPREITIPYERIQDVYIDQDLLDRIFGLYDVHLSTATISSGIEAHIDGVEKQAAEGLRNLLLQTIQQKISKNKTANISSNSNQENKIT